jgi:hypothetical protein
MPIRAVSHRYYFTILKSQVTAWVLGEIREIKEIKAPLFPLFPYTRIYTDADLICKYKKNQTAKFFYQQQGEENF